MDIRKLYYPQTETDNNAVVGEANGKKRRIVEILCEIKGGGIVYDEKTGSYTLFYHIQKDGKIYTHRKDVTDNFTEIEAKPKIVPYPSNCGKEKSISINKRSRKNIGVIDYDREWVYVSILQGILVNNAIPKDHVEIYSIVGETEIDTYGCCECL